MNEELKIYITAEIDKLKTELAKGKKEVEDFGKKSKVSFKEFNDAANKVGEVSKKALATVGVAVAGAATALLALSESTKEYRTNQAKLNTAFKTAGSSAAIAKEVYNDLYRVLGDSDTATEAAGHLAKLTTEQKALQEWTTICQGVFATFGDSLPIEGLTEAANETAKVGTVTGTLADALNWAGVSEDAFNEKLAACATESEREALIRETLNGLYNEAAANYEVNSAALLRQNEAQAKNEAAMARIGEAMQPVNTALTNMAATIFEKLAPYIEDFVENHLDELEAILTDVATAIGNVIGWIVDNWDTITTLGGVVLAIAAAWATYSTIMGIVNAVMWASPITWIIAGISALIGVIALCVINWDSIKEAGAKAWEGIKNAWANAGEWFKGVWEGIKGAFAKVGDWFGEKFQQARDAAQKAWEGIGNWAKDTYGKVKQGFANVDSFMTDKFGDAWTGIKKAFSPFVNFFKQIWESVKGIFSAVKNVLTGNFSDAWQSIKNVFSGWGSFFSNLWNNIVNTFKNIGTKIGNAVSAPVKEAINGVLAGAVFIINGFISAINFAIDIINAIPGVNIGRIAKLDVPKLAKGGIVDSATLAVVGEQGKEAVVPLENNLEWLDRLAGMLNERMGGGGKQIVLQVDGKTFAQTSIDSINQLTRQTGQLALQII